MRSELDDTFVIGDVHGEHELLLALLKRASIRAGDRVIQVGDLGNFTRDSESGDRLCYMLASGSKPPITEVLWGNHDRAVFDRWHAFGGFEPPNVGMRRLMESARPHFATCAHGYIITHAGIAQRWERWLGTTDPFEMVRLIERDANAPIIRAISWARGGTDDDGGILWRDDHTEPLMDVPQVYGHTSNNEVQKQGKSINLDIGSKHHPQLAGVWLPSGTIVEVR